MPRYHVTLTTPEAVARQLNTVNPNVSGIPAVIQDPADGQYADFWSYTKDLCHAISDYIMQACNRSFVPYLSSRSTAYRNAIYLDGNLYLEEDLLVPSTFEIGGITVGVNDYYLLPSNRLPYEYINFDASTVTGISGSYGASYDIVGTWGYHENLSQAWSVAQAAFSCTANETVLPVTDANAFETLQYLRCESEMMQVISRNVTDDELTVLRGVNGTTSVIHSAVPLETYSVIYAISLAATRLVAYYYQRRTDVGSTAQLPDGSIVISSMPEGVKETLLQYTRPVPPRSVKPRRPYAYRW
jgi:hypothetical protein